MRTCQCNRSTLCKTDTGRPIGVSPAAGYCYISTRLQFTHAFLWGHATGTAFQTSSLPKQTNAFIWEGKFGQEREGAGYLARHLRAVFLEVFYTFRWIMKSYVTHSRSLGSDASLFSALDTHLATFVMAGGRKWQLNEQTGCREWASTEAYRKPILY